jgi:FlaA1/EpsC-like NDP-sugar epimerase
MQTRPPPRGGGRPSNPAAPPAGLAPQRPPALSFICGWRLLRRALRSRRLLAIDFAGLFAALFSALMLKALVQERADPAAASYDEAMATIAFAYLVTALLFARSGLYADRAQRPGLPKIVSSLFQTTVVALIFALVNGEEYSSYYIFYGTLIFAIFYVGSLRWIYERLTGVGLRAAGYRRRAVLVGSGKHIEDVAHALADEVHAPVEMLGFISLTPRPDNGFARSGASRTSRRSSRCTACRR